jgi:4-amino-4-deoxy-L-arabinose transferase-like glycosyltransferase
MRRRILPWLALLAIVVAVAGATRAPLWDEDETRFASVAREMRESGDWVVPRFNGALADKPPLFFQTVGLSFRLFGESAAAARWPSVVAAALGLLASWLIARRLFDREVAIWSCLALGTSLLFLAEATLATTDAMLLACATWALVPAVVTWWRRGGSFELRALTWPAAVATGVLGGLGILVKGPAALILPLLTLWLFAWWTRPRPPVAGALRALATLRPGFVLAGAVAVVLPWHWQVWQLTGGEWFQVFYLQHHAGRLPFLGPWTGEEMQPVASHRGFPLFQFVALLGGMFPWSAFLPLAGARTVLRALGRGVPDGVASSPASARFVAVWLGVWLVITSLSSTQLPHYSFPAYPAAAMMIAALLVQAVRIPAGTRDGWLYAGAGGLLFGALLLLAGPAIAARLALMAPGILLFLPGASVLACGLGVLFAVWRRRREDLLAWVAAAALLLAVSVFGLAAPSVGRSNPLPRLILAADAAAGGSARLAAYRFALPGLVWESGRDVVYGRSAGEIVRFLESGPDAAVFVDEAALPEIAALMPRPPRVVDRGRPLFRDRDILVLAPP